MVRRKCERIDPVLKKLTVEVWEQLKSNGQITHSVDRCPYTPCFDEVYSRVNHQWPLGQNEFYRVLMNLRKQKLCKAPGED